MRSFFNDDGYLEVETPVLQPIPGVLRRDLLLHITIRLICLCTCVLQMSCI
jgi:elongation factor P--beta-lysine ligase